MVSTKIIPAAMQVPAAIAYSGIGRTTLYTLMSAGEIEAVKVGRRRLVLRDSIDAFLDRQPRVSHAA